MIKKVFRKTFDKAIEAGQSVAVAFALAFAAVLSLLANGGAEAQYAATTPTPQALFDWTAMTTAVLGIMGVALAAVGGYKISVGIGKKVIGWFGGRA